MSLPAMNNATCIYTCHVFLPRLSNGPPTSGHVHDVNHLTPYSLKMSCLERQITSTSIHPAFRVHTVYIPVSNRDSSNYTRIFSQMRAGLQIIIGGGGGGGGLSQSHSCRNSLVNLSIFLWHRNKHTEQIHKSSIMHFNLCVTSASEQHGHPLLLFLHPSSLCEFDKILCTDVIRA
jgi:hypothetical protein